MIDDPDHDNPMQRLQVKLAPVFAAALGDIEYDTEHQMLHIHRRNHSLPGQLDSIEIYAWPGRQARFCCTYVGAIDARGNRVFRNTRLKPVTIKGLRRVLRDARRVPEYHGRAHVTQPGELWRDLGCAPEKDPSHEAI
jgi:hypothetical protein